MEQRMKLDQEVRKKGPLQKTFETLEKHGRVRSQVGGHPTMTNEDKEEEKQRRKEWNSIKKAVSPLAMK